MPFFTETPELKQIVPFSADMWELGTLDFFANGFSHALATNPVQGARNLYSRFEPFRERISLEEQGRMIEEAGLIGVITPTEGYSREHLQLMLEQKGEEIWRQNVSSRASGFVNNAAGFAGGLAGSFVDPINIGSAFVPGLAFRGGISALRAIPATRAVGTSLLARNAARQTAIASATGWTRASLLARQGAVEGAIGAAMIEPLVYSGMTAAQADYSLADSLTNVFFGSMMGATLHPIAGMVHHWRHPNATPDSIHATDWYRQDFEQRNFEARMRANPNLDESLARQWAQADAALFDANARRWAVDTGRSVLDYYERNPVEFRGEAQTPLGSNMSPTGQRLESPSQMPLGSAESQSSAGARGAVSFDEGKAVITFFQNSDATTAPHEMFHIFRREMAEAAHAPGASDAIRARYVQMEDFVGARPGKAWTRSQEEKFARAGEAFLMEGRAPSATLQPAFDSMKGFFLDVYSSADAAGLEISPQMRNVFNDMLTVPFSEAERNFTYAVGDILTREPEVSIAAEAKRIMPDAEIARSAGTPEVAELREGIQNADADFATFVSREANLSEEARNIIAEAEGAIAESDARLLQYDVADAVMPEILDAVKQGEVQESFSLASPGPERLNPEDITTLYESAVEKRAAGMDDGEILNAIAEEINKDRIIELARNRALRLQRNRNVENLGYVLNTFRGKEGDGISALLVGSKYVREGSHMSVDSLGVGLSGQYRGELAAELNRLSPAHFRAFRTNTLQREIARALYTMNNPDAPKYNGPKMAMEIAEVVYRIQEKARVKENRAGAWIGRLPGYIARQTHDAYRIRKGGSQAWTGLMNESLDWVRTADGAYLNDLAGREKFLRDSYTVMSTGKHVRQNTMANELARTSRIGSAAARASRERVFIFKDADAWFGYQEKYGTGKLSETIVHGLDRAAKNTALMQVLGPSPQAGLESLQREATNALLKVGDDKGVRAIDSKRIRNQMKEVDNTINIEGNPSLAQVGRNVRVFENVTKLGGAVISAFSDIPNLAGALAYRGAGGWCENMLAAIRGLGKGRGSAEQQRILASLGVYFDSTMQAIAARMSNGGLDAGGINNRLNGIQNLFFRLSGLSWWTDTQKASAGLMLSHDLARQKNNSWAKLAHKRQRALSLYGIDEGKWEIIRRGETKAADGRHYLTPDGIETVPDEMFANYLRNQGRGVTPSSILALREEIQDQFRTYFSDGIGDAVIESSAKTRATLRQGLSAGTIPGEFFRFIAQFKAFGFEYANRFLSREVYGYGAESFTEGLARQFVRNQYGETGHLMRQIVAMTLFGYLSHSVKQLAAGKTPRDPADARTWVQALTQGGGLGIYGDFLFSELGNAKNRFGGSPLATFLGPTASSLESFYNLYVDLMNGDAKAANTFRTLWSHVPGNNLFYFKGAFDYLIAYNLYESLNPGYISRMKRRIEREQNQMFWLDPGTFVR